jgi:hypothetical protein
MWNNEGPIAIGAIWLCAEWARMHDCEVLHGDDVNVETARSEPYCWHSPEEAFEFFHAHEHLNRRRSWLVG